MYRNFIFNRMKKILCSSLDFGSIFFIQNLFIVFFWSNIIQSTAITYHRFHELIDFSSIQSFNMDEIQHSFVSIIRSQKRTLPSFG